MAEKEESKPAEGNRWWDHYYVRYFVGSVYAVLLMYVLSRTDAIKGSLGAIDPTLWVNATVLGAAGLAFCYIASAPILLLHAVRGRNTATILTVTAWWKLRWLLVAMAAVLMVLVVVAWCDSKDRNLKGALEMTPFVVVLATQLWAVFASLAAIVQFYKELAALRAAKEPAVLGARREYIESYRHMREHGNALLIIVMETILALALLQAPDVVAMLEMVLLWVLPASFAWFIGTTLEAHLKDIP